MNPKKAHILIAEDNEPDQIMIRRAFEKGHFAYELFMAENGKQAVTYLQEIKQSNAGKGYPDLIILDINMPVMDGKEALEVIRADESLKHLPVIVLTTSSRDKDVMESYQLGVNAYLTKPVDHADFVSTIQKLENFWLELVTLPPKTGG